MGLQLPLDFVFVILMLSQLPQQAESMALRPSPVQLNWKLVGRMLLPTQSFPGLNCELSAPINVSPAAVVSTGFTLNAGTNPW